MDPLARGPRLPDDARARARSARRLLGAAWWRLRFVAAALCCGLAATASVAALRPPPPDTVPVVLTTREVEAGEPVGSDDVRLVEVAAASAPAALRSTADAVGRTASVRLAPGTLLQESLVAAGELVAAAPDGTVVAPVRLDPAVGGLLAPGDRVDLLVAPGLAAPPDAGAQAGADDPYLARGAVVVPGRAAEPSGGGLLGTASGGGADVTLVAVRAGEAERLAAVAGWGEVTAVLVP
ncbi:SAF domain-containing protein [Cellulosimicrobium marinum]|uniref:SAF domain-containing protein n=1 Tax=Cellulosimicrobium marinum TaxID=1638992 RepID=UPI001E5FDEF6|nr:SAF domain-containing protein [Cellulosimicrobium marinum]MCB7136977.1 SAF domain-containing protein [Cellulosimicrobium marinum]